MEYRFQEKSPLPQSVPADGHGDDDRLPARIEKFSGGGDLPGNQHPQGAQRHKNRTHQWAGVVIVFCVGIKKQTKSGFRQQTPKVLFFKIVHLGFTSLKRELGM